MCPGFNSRTQQHMWVEFVVGSCPSSAGFSPGSPFFLPPQKSTFLYSNSIGNSRATGFSVKDCYVVPSLNNVNLFIFTPIGEGINIVGVLGNGGLRPEFEDDVVSGLEVDRVQIRGRITLYSLPSLQACICEKLLHSFI